MTELEKVITGLECCSVKQSCSECPWMGLDCNDRLHLAALELLKDQQETIASLQGTICKLNAALAEQPEQKFFVDFDGKITPLPIQPQWVRVEDRLPENSDTVLITHKGGVSFGWYNGRYWERGASTKHREIRTVSHWMPLPKAPEGDEPNGNTL